jgi:uncharacterized protein YdhG (YjbR/CyaY superfamily)/ribosomal protein S18 acetylase RimI-like enzyme
MEPLTITPELPDSEDVRWCFAQYYAELDRRVAGGFDVSGALPLIDQDLLPPLGVVLVARRSGQSLGCGAVKLGEPSVAEIKRLWVSPRVRGQGIGSRILAELESRAATAGKQVVRLDTNGALAEALALYRRRGYHEVPPFNAERFADHWFEKDLETVSGVSQDVHVYLAGLPTEARAGLDSMRATIRQLVPSASETISYGIPTFSLDGRAFVHVGAWKRHLSLYPVPLMDAELAAELAPYRSGPGTLRFPLGNPPPLQLIGRVVDLLVVQRAAAGIPVTGDRSGPSTISTEQESR